MSRARCSLQVSSALLLHASSATSDLHTSPIRQSASFNWRRLERSFLLALQPGTLSAMMLVLQQGECFYCFHSDFLVISCEWYLEVRKC